jgi:flagellar FliL protein
MAKKEDAKDDKEPEEKPAEGEASADGDGAAKKDPLAFLAFLPAKLRLPALIGAPVLLILIIVLGLVLGGVFNKKPVPKPGDEAMTEGADADAAKDAKNATPSVYYNMPDMLVNLDSRGRKQSVLKMSVTIEVGSAEDLKAVEEKAPLVLDEFQVFLRETRVEDLRGSAGIYRIRQELLARIKPAVAPVKVRDVLFKELLIQ